MSTAYANGEDQDSVKLANFTKAAKAMGVGFSYAAGVYALGEKTVETSKNALKTTTYSEVDSSVSGREGVQAMNIEGTHLSAAGLGMATAVLAYTGRREMKKAFVYGVKGLYKASKKTLSFAKKAVEELQSLTQEYVAEDRANPERNTLFNKINKFVGHTR